MKIASPAAERPSKCININKIWSGQISQLGNEEGSRELEKSCKSVHENIERRCGDSAAQTFEKGANDQSFFNWRSPISNVSFTTHTFERLRTYK